jgi:hypothetical protein
LPLALVDGALLTANGEKYWIVAPRVLGNGDANGVRASHCAS